MGRIPNRIIIHDTFSGQEFEKMLSDKKFEDKITFSEIIPTEGDYYINERILIKFNSNIWCSYTKIDKTSENFPINDVCIYFKGEDVDSFLEEIKKCSVKFEESDGLTKMNVISVSNGSLELDPVSDKFEFNENIRSKREIKNIKKTLKSIKNNNKTLSILRGPRGIGKTQIVKWILSELDMISIFIPINMVDHTINNPEFKNFLKRFEKCVLILDDSEFNYGFNRLSNTSGNIIQLLESWSMQNLHVIMIFNVNDGYQLDEDLIQCNNLLNYYHFNLIDPEAATKLSEKIGFNVKYKNHVTISNIINNSKIEDVKNIGIK